jgi:hypothetical protein
MHDEGKFEQFGRVSVRFRPTVRQTDSSAYLLDFPAYYRDACEEEHCSDVKTPVCQYGTLMGSSCHLREQYSER